MISTVTTATTTVTIEQTMAFGVVAIVSLIAFLALREIMSPEAENRPSVASFIRGSTVAIVPLLLVFVTIVGYKVISLV